MAVIDVRRKQDGTVSYRARITLKGHPRLSQTFRRKSDARSWAQTTEAAIRQRQFFPGAEANQRTFGELAERFIAEKLSTRVDMDRRRLTNQLNWWVENLGEDIVLARITPAQIVEARDKLANGASLSGRQVSPATVKRYLALLSKVFSTACKEWFWLESNPCQRVPRPQEPRGRVRYLSEDERRRLLEVCRSSPARQLYPLVLTALATGARQGELSQLRWKDLNLEEGIAIFHQTKNGERRAVPVTGTALDELRRLSGEPHGPDDPVFASSRGLAKFPRHAWDVAVSTAGIEDFHFHDLRHTAASYLAMSGATLAEIAEVLGHKTLAMVKRYAHLTHAHTRGVVSRMTAKYL